MLGIKLFFLSLLSFFWVVSLILAYLNSSSPWLFQELLANRNELPRSLLRSSSFLQSFIRSVTTILTKTMSFRMCPLFKQKRADNFD